MMDLFFKNWRFLDQSKVNLPFEKEYVYYVHARAWALKGYLGGTHSWTVFWSTEHDQWLVVELSDIETIDVQQGTILWMRNDIGYQDRGPIISNRAPNAKWFGATPIIVGKSKNTFIYDDFVKVCDQYPIQNFKLLNFNCNTFTSFLSAKLNLNIRRPLRSIGYKKWKKE